MHLNISDNTRNNARIFLLEGARKAAARDDYELALLLKSMEGTLDAPTPKTTQAVKTEPRGFGPHGTFFRNEEGTLLTRQAASSKGPGWYQQSCTTDKVLQILKAAEHVQAQGPKVKVQLDPVGRAAGDDVIAFNVQVSLSFFRSIGLLQGKPKKRLIGNVNRLQLVQDAIAALPVWDPSSH